MRKFGLMAAVLVLTGALVGGVSASAVRTINGTPKNDVLRGTPGADTINADAADGAEALVIATEWAEFANVDLEVVKEKMTTPIVFDGRNLFDPSTMAKMGFRYHSIGRTPVTPD